MEYTGGKWKATKAMSGNWLIMPVGGGGCIARSISSKANAQLIAASPDLYEACKQALRTFEAHHIKPTDPRYITLERAIAKAESK